ncbi:hypothetical protein COCSUDRAFT_47953 [Coccomyxa subellipsoidea C-169]|uniref:Uncharacterized protein n=1 Tax=Coccomyxa subellipsoidea (strain C-169) TaxID=574566 RepID=I0YTV9_COCSC|nr:hypothetical protein COCSUDRAFT_47953 [Coccomyxa subellipsoidea C-169]EIE21828.1 hypothetical protein COCSUDRAFT_47953 [Coccomyxa subellipsoidea C-169]|eukprot:XP_005646372.1 hypothetical protein COCSUDRAFT_47953 [Coccomyxa subellipsoidea C-169]
MVDKRYAIGNDMSTRFDRGTEDDLARSAEALAASFASSFVTPLRAASASTVLQGVRYVSIVVPASTGQVISVANLATAGPLHMTLLHSSQCAAGHTLQHRWAFTSSLFSHFKDIQAFPEAAQAAALICHPLLEQLPGTPRNAPKPRLQRAHSAPVLLQRAAEQERAPATPAGVHRKGSLAAGLELEAREPDFDCGAGFSRLPRLDEEPVKLPVIGALVLGLDTNKPPPKRRVEQLAALLAPLIAPLAGRAVDIASAAYLARTLSRQPSEPWHAPASTSPDQRAPSGEEISTGGSGSSGIRRMATESWILSIGERALLRQLLNNASLTQRSISALPWRGDRSPMMSPLMSSMDVASRRDSSSSEFTFTPCMPLVDSPTGSQRLQSPPHGSVQRALSAEPGGPAGIPRSQPQPIPAGEPPRGFFADDSSCPAASPAASGRTILLGEESVSSAANQVENPFAGAGAAPAGGSPPGTPPTWSAATAARWGHPAPTTEGGTSPRIATGSPTPRGPTPET